MKIVHTADWHLGKLVQGVYMTEDQDAILQQFVQQMALEKPDVIVIAGDIYDRSLPPVEAVNVLNKVLAQLIGDLNIPVLAIAGNHDSPGRLQFGSDLMRSSGYYIAGQLTSDLAPVILTDDFGEVHFHLVPFAEPSHVKQLFADDTIQTPQQAMAKIIAHINATSKKEARHVFVGHAFVTANGEEEENTSDSERPLVVGGAECVSAKYFANFNYVALGHLHQAHQVGDKRLQYAGSPLKYSLSEQHHKKGYLIIELDAEGAVTVEKKALLPRRDLRQITASMDEILQHEVSEDYVFIVLTDEHSITSPMEKIRTVYPNAMHVSRKLPADLQQEAITVSASEKLNDLELFTAFYEEIAGQLPEQETAQLFEEALQSLLSEQHDYKEAMKR